MLHSLITSKTRVRLLIRFFLNPEAKSYLRELASEFGESTNAVRVELNRLSDAGLLISSQSGRNRFYQANSDHPLFPEIQNIVRKTLGLDHLIEKLTSQLGDIKRVFLVGDYARGIDSGFIELLIIGEADKLYLDNLVTKVEKKMNRKIRTLILNEDTFSIGRSNKWKEESRILLWEGHCE